VPLRKLWSLQGVASAAARSARSGVMKRSESELGG
jgi:hypothetical protein